jgi:hypothetical protein
MFKETTMRSIHLKDIHVPTGPNLFAFSVSEAVFCCGALVFLLVSWGVGGDDMMESLGGRYSLAILLAGIAIGIVLGILTRPKS